MYNSPESNIEFLSRLDKHPDLRSKFELILDLLESTTGSFDHVEGELIGILRSTGTAALQSWATSINDALPADISGYIKDGKKNFCMQELLLRLQHTTRGSGRPEYLQHVQAEG